MTCFIESYDFFVTSDETAVSCQSDYRTKNECFGLFGINLAVCLCVFSFTLGLGASRAFVIVAIVQIPIIVKIVGRYSETYRK